jgi:predicted DNA-binding transcriptional regulator AlpA
MSPRRKLSRPAIPALPVSLNDSQVLRLPEWAQLARISLRTARRLMASGDGPRVVRLSSRRFGVTLAAHKEWIASRERVSS